MIVVKSKNQFGEEILINSAKICYVVPSSGGQESVIFFDNDTHISILEPLNEFRKRFEDKTTVKVSEHNNVTNSDLIDGYPAYLPRLPNGNVDKRTLQYKEYVAVAHHPV